jgi:hypothetical protein
MPERSTSLAVVVVASALVWTVQDQLLRFEALAPEAFLVMLFGVLALFAGWVAWWAHGQWRRAASGAVALTVGMQIGRVLSDFIYGMNWSGSDYWQFWGTTWPILLVVNSVSVFALLFPMSWLQRRWHDAAEPFGD